MIVVEGPLVLRPAETSDARLLLTWRNDPGTRRWTETGEIVPWPTHVTWLGEVLVSPRQHLLIAEAGGEPVGTARFVNHGDDMWEIGYTVAPECRGQGFGTKLVATALEFAKETMGPTEIRAAVDSGNEASVALLRRLGFEPIEGETAPHGRLWFRTAL
jgi:RimJ/RimL family protein N-acetyltransferase